MRNSLSDHDELVPCCSQQVTIGVQKQSLFSRLCNLTVYYEQLASHVKTDIHMINNQQIHKASSWIVFQIAVPSGILLICPC